MAKNLKHRFVSPMNYIICRLANNNSGAYMDKKVCFRCGVEKRITAFKQCKYYPDGRTKVCRWCYTHNKLKDRTWSKEQKESFGKKLKGRKYSLKHRLAISRGQKKAVAEGRHHWKKNDRPHPDAFRTHLEYKLWKEKVLEIAGSRCEKCASTKRLHVHHKKCYYKYESLRVDVSNGEVLCQSCHTKLMWQNKRNRVE